MGCPSWSRSAMPRSRRRYGAGAPAHRWAAPPTRSSHRGRRSRRCGPAAPSRAPPPTRLDPDDSGLPRVAVVQSNVQPAFHWTRGHAEQQLLANLRLTERLADAHPSLVVWPENAVTVYLEQEPYIADQLHRVAARLGVD